MAKRTFKFSFEFTLTGLVFAGVCWTMGWWQYTRWQEKMAYEVALETAEDQGPRAFDATLTDPEGWLLSDVSFEGTFEHQHTMFLINRSKDNETGVRVVTPVRIEGEERRLLVDRGFLPFADYRNEDRAHWQPDGALAVQGKLRPSQLKSFFLSPTQKLSPDGSFKDRWFRLEVGVMAEQLPYPVYDFYLEQSNQIGAYPAFDPRSVLPSSRHLNYVLQWAGFGIFALALFFWFQYRPVRPEQPAKEPTPSPA